MWKAEVEKGSNAQNAEFRVVLFAFVKYIKLVKIRANGTKMNKTKQCSLDIVYLPNNGLIAFNVQMRTNLCIAMPITYRKQSA